MDTTTRSTKVLRMKDVSKKVGYAPSTIYELVALGKSRGYRNAVFWAKRIWNARQHRQSA